MRRVHYEIKNLGKKTLACDPNYGDSFYASKDRIIPITDKTKVTCQNCMGTKAFREIVPILHYKINPKYGVQFPTACGALNNAWIMKSEYKTRATSHRDQVTCKRCIGFLFVKK